MEEWKNQNLSSDNYVLNRRMNNKGFYKVINTAFIF